MKIGGYLMKITTTLEEIIKSELINQGDSEFISKDKKRFIAFDDDGAFIKRILFFDDDVYNIVNHKFFLNETLDNVERDKDFKKHFISRFYAKQIGYQTIERFAGNVLSVFLNNQYFLNQYYNNLDDFINQLQESKSKDKGNTLNDSRLLESDLPQNQINLNVDDTVLNYGNLNRITRQRNQSDGSSDSIVSKKDLDILVQSRELLNDVLSDFERQCFLYVW